MEKKCLNCDSTFNINDNWKQERKKKFCSNSCSNSYNNKIRYKKKEVDSKVCRFCNEVKEVKYFYKRKNSVDGYRNECKACFKHNKINKKVNSKKYYENNKELIKERSRNYYKENKEKVKELAKTRAEKNKDKRNKKLNERYHNDVLYRLTVNTRNLISKSIKRNGFSKNSKTREILGCSFEEFKSHIENKFIENMSWENYGEWHIDHKTPSSWANSEEEIIKLNHYTNLQPLWAEDNLSKGNYYEG